MAASGVATKSKAPAPKQPSRQPPADTVWLRYHPWMEGALGHVSSWAIHLLVIGGGLFLFFDGFNLSRAKQRLPVEPVLLDSGGGGDPTGSGADKGTGGVLKEGAQTDQQHPGDKSSVAPPSMRPHLDDVTAKKVQQDFSPETARQIMEGPEAMQTFAGLDKDLRDKLRDGINPAQGKGGTGTGTGEGSGTGTGTGTGTGAGTGKVLNEREKRMLRWTMKFKTQNSADYLRQFEGLGAIIAVPVGPDAFKVVDLSKKPYRLEDRDLSTIQRIWWTDSNADSAAGLMAAMNIPIRPPFFVAFISPELEDDLAKKELAFRGLKTDDIYETKFDIYQAGGKYDVRVYEETSKAEALRMGLLKQ